MKLTAAALLLLPLAAATRTPDVAAMLGLANLVDADVAPQAAIAAAAPPTNPLLLPPASLQCFVDSMTVLSEPGLSAGGKFMLDAFGKVPAAFLESGLFSYGSYSECLRERDNWTLPEPRYSLNTFSGFPGKFGTCLPYTCDQNSLPAAWPYILFALLNGVAGTATATVLYNQIQSQVPWFLKLVPHIATKSEFFPGAIITVTILCMIGATVLFATALDYFRTDATASAGKGRDEKDAETERLIQTPAPASSSAESAGVATATPADADGEKPQVATAVTIKSESAWKNDSKKESLLAKAVGNFSLFRSLPRLLHAEGEGSNTAVLNGIRAISMFWVLLAHVYFYSSLNGVDNIRDFPVIGDRWIFQVILNAFVAVDTFFFLSGFLVCFGALLTIHKTKKFSYVLYVVSRLMRILPTYALVLFVFWKLQGFFGEGPLWYTRQTNPNCDKYWWTNLLFINNFEPGDVNKECMGWTWYLAVDFQCYLVAPLIFLPLYYTPRVGEMILGLFILITTTLSGLLTIFYDLPATSIVKSVSGNNYSTIMYVKPYTRFAPYGIGMLVAYLFVKLSGRLDPPVNNTSAVPAATDAATDAAPAKTAKPKLRELTPELLGSPLRLALWYAVAGTLLLSSLFGTYSLHQADNLALSAAQQAKKDQDPWPMASRFMYNAYGHLGWSLGLGMLVWSMLAGRSRALSWFLSGPIWGVLAKLTFVAYLVHEMIVDIYFNSLSSPWHFGDILNFGVFLNALVASYAVAAIVWLTFEGPMGGIVKIILGLIMGAGKRK